VIRREVVSHPGAVVILPLLDPETVVLIRNERYVVQKTLWELPAGTLEPKEEPLVCAKRELIEETGYKAKQMTPLLTFYSTPGFCNEVLHSYLAEDLEFVGQDLDETEKIETVPMKLSEAYKMIREGIICDAKTICTLLYLHLGRERCV
jgi:ADP-ribose pyrophosphatase